MAASPARIRFRGIMVLTICATALAGAGCDCRPTSMGRGGVATAPAGVPREDLAELAQGHSDKIRFAWYASTLRHTAPPVQVFVNRMAADQKRLLAELTAWAKKKDVHLAHAYPNNVAGRAQRLMDQSQENIITSDTAADFQRDLLIQMWQDYDWQRSLAQALLATTTDPELKAYLEDSVHTHTAGIKQIRELLARYKFE